ncbi:hypothetical protein BDV97DRAFT_353551 [Delphinella strobiligena]|nr:hypothetical protein BDV97DRAFT_353551 [Delphinella strobiligena]
MLTTYFNLGEAMARNPLAKCMHPMHSCPAIAVSTLACCLVQCGEHCYHFPTTLSTEILFTVYNEPNHSVYLTCVCYSSCT